jgi:hypothetical protein
VRRLPNRTTPVNWEITVIDSGTSDGARCKEALAEIYARRADQYELIGG